MWRVRDNARQRMINGQPTFDELIAAAASRLQEGDAIAAERAARRALAQHESSSAALSLLGFSLNEQHRFPEAVRAFTAVAQREPAERAHWVNLGTAARAAGWHDEALAAYTRAAQLGEGSADFFFNIGLLHIDRGDYDAAQAVLERAAALAPRDAEIRHQLASCYYDRLCNEQAIAALADWSRCEGLTPQLVARIALLYINLGETRLSDEAVAWVGRQPVTDAATDLALLQIFERGNRVTEAQAKLAKLKAGGAAQTLCDDLKLAEAQLAQRAGRTEIALQLFTAVAAQETKAYRRHFHLYPLAKSCDAAGQFERAYETLVAAHASQVELLKLTNPDAVSLRRTPMLITRRGCMAADLAHWQAGDAPALEQSPVFIVAFPRSGTTLLELTLDAHPDLVTMDEQPFLQNAIDRMAAFGADYPGRLAGLDAAQLASVRGAYWELVQRKVQLAPGQRLIDKNPLNLLRLPAIVRLWPKARIILAIRHPCDVILSCFMQHFRAPEFALLCRDLPTLASGWRRAFDFWYEQQALLHAPVHEVRYESFVEQFEPRLREIAGFLELRWHDAMLAPAEHAQRKGYISTPSYSQVVQPLNSRSVGRWKNYRRHFDPVMEEVRPYLERWHYER
jgi:tetratricopeptide (TPR) repeat protein